MNAEYVMNVLVLCLVTPHSACALRTGDETEFDPDEPPMARTLALHGMATVQLHYSNVTMAGVPRFRRIAKSSVPSGATADPSPLPCGTVGDIPIRVPAPLLP